jgi:subtilisin family serine protease
MVNKIELQLILVVAFLITLGVFAYGPRSSVTGMVTSEVENGQRVIVILKENIVLAQGNQITGNAVGSSPDSLEEAKEQIIEDVNDEGFFGLLSEEDVAQEHELDELPVMIVEATEEGIEKLEEHPLVKEVIIDFALDLYLQDSVPLVNASYVHNISVNGQNLTGEGVAVCYIDTGITPLHEAFTGRIVREKCLCQGCCQGSSQSDDATDTHSQSHGTHVAGIIGANAQKIGVAPGVNLVAVKVCGGSCMLADVLAGMNFCVAQKNNYGIKVMSVSLGDNSKYITQGACPTYLDSAINAAYNAGMIVTIASGNNGYTNGISYPSCSPNAMAIGATTKADAMASYSNRGILLEMLAPGSSISSSVKNGGYGSLSGTSMSSPHVAGAAAILYQYAELAGINYTVDDIWSALLNSSMVSGFPRLDVYSSLKSLGYRGPVHAVVIPWNVTVLSPMGRVPADDVLFSVNITGNYSNTTVFTITWSSNESKKDWTGNNVFEDLNLGNQTITVNVTDGNFTFVKEFEVRAVPVVNCSIDLDINGDDIVTVGDMVILSQNTNISCTAPIAMPTCLVDLETTNVTEKELKKYLGKIAARDIKDVYGEHCLVGVEEI